MSQQSRAQILANLPDHQREAFLSGLSIAEKERLAWCLSWSWEWKSRPAQIAPPGPWVTWLILAGRGFGKTTSGVQWVREKIAACHDHVSIIVPTYGDISKVLVEGEAGFLKAIPKEERPTWNGGKSCFMWPKGQTSFVFSADAPDRLRGSEHSFLWCDELAAWRYADAWDQAMFGLRLGSHPQVCVTTTPRPTPLVKSIASSSTTHITRGSTYDNKANLAPTFLAKIVEKYEGTRLGRQELYAEILGDNPGALWKRDQIDATRISPARLPQLSQIVVAVDPAASNNPDSDETGIVIVGRDSQDPPHFYVIEDCSLQGSPDEWATAAVKAWERTEANCIVAEVNQGGDMVEAIIRTKGQGVPYQAVRASRGKATRAEPVAALYEQGRVHHVGSLPKLEDQMCEWDPTGGGDSPDRMDALVWGVTAIMNAQPGFHFF